MRKILSSLITVSVALLVSSQSFAEIYPIEKLENFNDSASTIAPYNCIVDNSWTEKPSITLHYSSGPENYIYPEHWVLDNSYGVVAMADYAKKRGLNQEETWTICKKMARKSLINRFIFFTNSKTLLRRSEPIPLPSISRVILTDNTGNIQKNCYLEPTQRFKETRVMQFLSDTAFLHKYQAMIGDWWNEESPEKVNAWRKFLEVWKWENLVPSNDKYYEGQLRAIFQGLGPVNELEESMVEVVCEKPTS